MLAVSEDILRLWGECDKETLLWILETLEVERRGLYSRIDQLSEKNQQLQRLKPKLIEAKLDHIRDIKTILEIA